jgi:hypothetical protein
MDQIKELSMEFTLDPTVAEALKPMAADIARRSVADRLR